MFHENCLWAGNARAENVFATVYFTYAAKAFGPVVPVVEFVLRPSQFDVSLRPYPKRSFVIEEYLISGSVTLKDTKD